MGTSRPTLYHVLHDEIGFTSDDVQQLTYWVSFRYQKKSFQRELHVLL
jgi:eukaryotic translation initiation factor 2C